MISVRTGTLRRVDLFLGSVRTPDEVVVKESRLALASLTHEKAFWHAGSFQLDSAKMNGIELAYLLPAREFLNLVDILCEDIFQSDQT